MPRRESEGKSSQRIFFTRESSVKVYLHNYLAVEFVPYVSVSFTMLQMSCVYMADVLFKLTFKKSKMGLHLAPLKVIK